jgi:hypothetical protein
MSDGYFEEKEAEESEESTPKAQMPNQDWGSMSGLRLRFINGKFRWRSPRRETSVGSRRVS